MIQEQEQEEKKKRPLYEFAFIRKLEDVLQKLKSIDSSEKWEYVNTLNERPLPILYNYIHHTFSRIKEQNKIRVSGKYKCFNTGLVTDKYEEIFMLFKEDKYKTEGYYFLDFYTESDSNMGKFSPLPERATYFTDISDVFYDINRDLRINIKHIIDDKDNFARFPKHIQDLSPHQLLNTFNGAIEHAKKRVNRNYKTAIPQYYRGEYCPDGQLQLLLPLCLTEPSKADLALAVYKKDDFYMGRTCLTLDMAINNARLIAKPDDEWLKP